MSGHFLQKLRHLRLSLPVLRQDPVPILLNTLESFTTLRRRVEVYFHHIRIHDDGDIDLFGEDDDGEAKFWLSVMEGKTLVNAFSWGLGDVSDKEGKNTVLFDPPLKYVLGPKSVTFDRRSVGVNIQGLEDDNTGVEYAVSAPNIHAFEVPVGRG